MSNKKLEWPSKQEQYDNIRKSYKKKIGVDIEEGKDFFHDFAGEEKYIEKIQKFIEDRKKIYSSESSAGTQAQVEDLEKKLTHPAIARMIGINTVWHEGIKEVPQIYNEQTFQAITTLLAFTGQLGKYWEEIDQLKRNILRVYPEARI